MSLRHLLVAICTTAAVALAGCGEDDPRPTPDSSVDAAVPDGGGDAGDASIVDSGPTCRADGAVFPGGGDNAGCTAMATDYTPRVSMSQTDTWAACISDDNVYHPFNASISSIARVAAYEVIRAKLFTGLPPSGQDFTDARVAYVEANGLESRVTRREDEHYPAAAAACTTLNAADLAANADRCAGPAKLQPLLNAAFLAGSQGQNPLVNAARIEAGLLWFLYISVHKEARTCATTAVDCDSSFAYYTGGEARSAGLGLSSVVRGLSPQAHDRIWDGVLATRCWRDLDNPTGAAADLVLRDRAVAQLDRGLLRGMALIVRERATRLAGRCGVGAEADLAFLQIVGGFLDREASIRNPTAAATLRSQLASTTPDAVDPSALIGALDTLFPCP